VEERCIATDAMKRTRKPAAEKDIIVTVPRKKVNNGVKEKAVLIVQTVTEAEQAKFCSVEWHAPSVTLSLRDRASQLLLSEDQMTCNGVEVMESTFD
jgi:hypothetical protein